MDINGNTYWDKIYENDKNYSSLDKNINCDILIIGGGITSSITAYFLNKLNLNIVIVDKKRVGDNSTKASTALLEYQTDELLSNNKNMLKFYNLCLLSTYKIENICKEINCKCNRCNTLLYTTKKKDIKTIIKEQQLRNKYFKSIFINNFNGFNSKACIFTKNSSLTINPYEFTIKLFNYLDKKKNIKIYEDTKINDLKKIKGKYIAFSNKNYKITSKYVILANGFSFYNFIKNRKNKIYKTYTIITNKIANNFYNNFTARDLNNPYHYLRFTNDNRIIFGGCDIILKPNMNCKKLHNVAIKKYNDLLKELKKIYNFKNLKIDYAFNGTFVTTKDTLPIIDEIKSNLFCNMSYGANGILYSVIGAIEIYNKIKHNKKLSKSYRLNR